MRTVLLLFVFALTCNAVVSIDTKIENTSKRLKEFNTRYKNLHTTLQKNAKAILEQNRAVLKQQKALEKLKKQIAEKEQRYEEQKAELAMLHTSQESLEKAQNEIEQELAFAIAKNASLSVLLEDERAKNADALIMREAIEQLAKQTQNRIDNLKNRFSDNNDEIGKMRRRIEVLRTSIMAMDEKRKELQLSLDANNKALQKLRSETKEYKSELTKIVNRQQNLKKRLSQLNILKEEKIKEQKERERQRLLAQKQAQEDAKRAKEQRENLLVEANSLPKIKQVGSSYQRIKTKRYRGKKTIAPLDGYSVIKKYGPYTDPIYNIKIFNESVSLKPKNANAKVKNIFNGKVVMAEKMAMLNNVVIVQHANGLHSIYANLDKIAPTIKKGKKIRKGSIIGRVSDELILEITQKSYHINPLQVIR